MFTLVYLFAHVNIMFTRVNICGIAEENRPTGAKFAMEIIDL